MSTKAKKVPVSDPTAENGDGAAPPETAMLASISENGEATRLPKAPAGMITLPPPRGLGGHIFVPDPQTWLTARQMTTYYRRHNAILSNPDFIQDSFLVHSNFYRVAPLCQFHLLTPDNQPYEITDEMLLDLDYPNQLAELVWSELEEMVEAAKNQKN
jgi:hypothetical protein